MACRSSVTFGSDESGPVPGHSRGPCWEALGKAAACPGLQTEFAGAMTLPLSFDMWECGEI